MSFAAGTLEGRRCVITGGGTGIGLATAELCVKLGARVALLGRRVDVVAAAAEKLGAAAIAAACDIREPAAVENAVAFVLQRLGGVDLLVNNAGGQFPSPAEGISPNGFLAVVKNNLAGTWNMTREVALKAMIPARSGVVVNVIANVERGFPGMMHTGAARAGVDNMTKSLAVEWTKHRIRVNAVAPGIIGTDALQNYPESIRRGARASVPMRRLGTADDVAQAIVFLGSELASYITGETLYVDGGARLWGDLWQIQDDV